jgi:hypothetical protein
LQPNHHRASPRITAGETASAAELGLKNLGDAAITIAGVELLHRIRKNQSALSRLRVRGRFTAEIWNAVIAA